MRLFEEVPSLLKGVVYMLAVNAMVDYIEEAYPVTSLPDLFCYGLRSSSTSLCVPLKSITGISSVSMELSEWKLIFCPFPKVN